MQLPCVTSMPSFNANGTNAERIQSLAMYEATLWQKHLLHCIWHDPHPHSTLLFHAAGHWSPVPALQTKVSSRHRRQPVQSKQAQCHLCVSEGGISTHNASKAHAQKQRTQPWQASWLTGLLSMFVVTSAAWCNPEHVPSCVARHEI